MEFMDRLVTALLDGKFASYDAKKELAEALGLKIEEILGFELLTDNMEIHQAIAVTIAPNVTINKKALDSIEYDYLTVNSKGCLILVICDEPK